MTQISGIPVKHYGVTIGHASIADDGRVEMTLDSSQEFGADLARWLENGMVDAVNISPLYVPAEPQKPRGIHNVKASTY